MHKNAPKLSADPPINPSPPRFFSGDVPALTCSSNPYLCPTVRPDSELQRAVLLIEGKVLDADVALALVDGRRFPLDASIIRNRCFRHQRYDVITVGAIARTTTKELEQEW